MQIKKTARLDLLSIICSAMYSVDRCKTGETIKNHHVISSLSCSACTRSTPLESHGFWIHGSYRFICCLQNTGKFLFALNEH